MAPTITPLTKELPLGMPSPGGGDPVRRVVFGRRLTGADIIRIEDDSQSDVNVQKPLMYAQKAIVEFGEKKRAPYLAELMQLSNADRSALLEFNNEFQTLTLGHRAFETLDDGQHKLAFGVEVDNVLYDIAAIGDKGSLLTGYDEKRIEDDAEGAYELMCATLGYDIESLSQSEGDAVLAGPIPLKVIKRLDAYDLNRLMGAAGKRRRLFRRSSRAMEDRGRSGSTSAGENV